MVDFVETKKIVFEWLVSKQDECYPTTKKPHTHTQQEAKFKNYKRKYM